MNRAGEPLSLLGAQALGQICRTCSRFKPLPAFTVEGPQKQIQQMVSLSEGRRSL